MELVLPGIKNKMVDGLTLVSDDLVGQSVIAKETVALGLLTKYLQLHWNTAPTDKKSDNFFQKIIL